MIRYYLLMFVRNFRKQRMFSFINVLGLTTGIASTLLIYLYVEHELSHDRFHERGDNIYRINQTFIWGEDNDQLFSSTGPGVAFALTAEIPEVKEVVRIHAIGGNSLIRYMNPENELRAFDEKKILFADSNFFRVFTFGIISGNPETALQHPNSVVITESTAKRYFDNADPLGKMIQVADIDRNKPDHGYVVTGVVNDCPDNSYIEFDFLMSMASIPRVKESNWSWVWTMFETFVLLDENASPVAVREKLKPLPRKYAETTMQYAMGTTFDEYTKSGKQWNLYLQPFTEIHLHSENIYNRLNTVGSIKVLYILMGIVFFIIVLSCINFMNLSTAQYTRRMKETSLRKVLGSSRWQLAANFMVEAFLFCVIAVILGLGLTQIFLPYFSTLTGSQNNLNIFSDKNIIPVILSLLAMMCIFCGLYPSLSLSAIKPVDAMKGKMRSGKEGRVFRNGLVVFQFAISIVLIASTMIVFEQLSYLSSKDVGFDRKNLLVINRVELVNDKETFQDALASVPGVEKVSNCSSVPPNLFDGDGFQVEDNRGETFNLNYVKADEHYAPTLELQFVAGKNFTTSAADVQAVILNETAVKDRGWNVDESVIGKHIFYPGDDNKFHVVGVVKDFNYWALAAPVEAMAIFNIKSDLFYTPRHFCALRIRNEDAGQWDQTVQALQQKWKQFAGDLTFNYEFVDDSFEKSFAGEKKFAMALSVFASLAILIACLGLLGMIIFTLELRTKEIGIRKVIGASEWSIVKLISKDYTRLIILAAVISVPLTWWSMNFWLEGFLYRITIHPLIFVVAGVSTFLIAVAITSYHSIKAALRNPVDVLKDE